MIKVTVPATSANLGSGVDCLGVALPIYLTATFEEADALEIVRTDGAAAEEPDKNLIYIAVRKVFRLCNQAVPPMRITVNSGIPDSRGLGSSGAAITAGVCGANAWLGNKLTLDELIKIAAELEGHPDNVVPCMTGGLAVSLQGAGEIISAALPLSTDYVFIAVVPDFALKTATARDVLPKTVSMQDAVRQIQRACYLVAALSNGWTEKLDEATTDLLFTPARKNLVPGYDAVVEAARKNGALCAYLSGAGPTIVAIALYGENTGKIAEAMQAAFAGAGVDSAVHILSADLQGTIVQTVEQEVL